MRCQGLACVDPGCACQYATPSKERPRALPPEKWPGRARTVRAWRMWSGSGDGQCPPIVLPLDVPPHAFVAASRALARDHGVRTATNRGGWDSCEVHGLGAGGLAHAWADARRCLGKRFAAIVRFRALHADSAVPSLRGLSDAQVRHVLRALVRAPFASMTQSGRRQSSPHLDHHRDRLARDLEWSRVSVLALAALGRLSPSGQWAACQGALTRAHLEYGPRRRDAQRRITDPVVRIRHLDWEAVRSVETEEARIRAMQTPVQARVRAARWIVRHPGKDFPEWARYGDASGLSGGLQVPRSSAAMWLAPAYPRISIDLAARVALGARPTGLAPGLTATEAHEWLIDGAPHSPSIWLAARLAVGRTDLRDVAAVRWLAAIRAEHYRGDVARSEALHRWRTLTGPHGESVQYSYALRLDEITEADLPQGTRTSVTRAFERAAERFTAEKLAELAREHEQLAPAPDWAGRLPRCARLLNTPAALVREGADLNHCVGGYAGYVRDRSSVILALDVRGARSTVELRHGVVAQHYGPGNAAPAELCARALKTILVRIARIAKGPKP